jgi:hypothetical protein
MQIEKPEVILSQMLKKISFCVCRAGMKNVPELRESVCSMKTVRVNSLVHISMYVCIHVFLHVG